MKILKYILIVVLFPLSFSCEDFVDRPPLDEIAEDDYWRSADDLNKYLMQYYDMGDFGDCFPGHGTDQAGMPKKEDGSDNLIRVIEDRTMAGTRGITTGSWISDWDEVRSINIFFDNYEKCEDDFNIYKHYLGEAHFFRAWFYFKLVNKYGDVPWITKPLYPDSEELQSPRDPRTLVVDNILADLDQAISYLDTRADVDGGNTRINKEFALAFKTRVALFEGTWQKYHAQLGTPFATSGADPDKYFRACVDAAEELMNGNYTVGIYNKGNPSEDYFTLFGLDDMGGIDEVLFYRAYNSAEGLANDMQNKAPDQMGVTWWLVSSYLAKDGTPYNYLDLASTIKGNDFLTTIAEDCDPRLSSTVWIPGDLVNASSGATFKDPDIDGSNRSLCTTGFQVKKCYNPYAPMAWESQTGGVSETGYIISRYGEVLLNYAEAKYELDGTVAYEQLNLLRERVGMPDFTVISQASDPNVIDYGYTVSDELYEIRRERRVELALEVFREDDYRRWAAHDLFKGKRPKGYPFDPTEFPEYNPPLDSDGLIDYLQKRLPDGYGFQEGRDYLDDIPQEEMTLNPNLEPNPGW